MSIPIIVSLVARSAGFNSAVAGASSRLASFNRSLGQTRSLAQGLGMAAAVVGIKELGEAVFKAHERFEAINIGLKVTTGSLQGSREEMDFIRAEADRLGLGFLDLADGYKKFTAATMETNLAGSKTREMFSGIMEAGTVFRLSQDDLNGVMRAFGQILSKGKVQSEELRGQLGERLPAAFKIAADAMGMTTAELDKALNDGKVNSLDFVEKFSAALRKVVEGELPAATATATAKMNRLTNSWDSFKISLAKSGVIDFIVVSINSLTWSLNLLNKAMGNRDKLKPISMTDIMADNLVGAQKSLDETTKSIKFMEQTLINSGDKIKAASPVAYQKMVEALELKKKLLQGTLADVNRFSDAVAKGTSEFEKNMKKPASKPAGKKEGVLSDSKSKLSTESQIMLEEESKSLSEFAKKIRDAKSVYKDLVTTPADEFISDIANINLLAERGIISWKEFGEAAELAHIRMSESAAKESRKTATELQQAMDSLRSNIDSVTSDVVTNFLFMTDRARTFANLLDDFLNSVLHEIIGTLVKLATQYLINAAIGDAMRVKDTAAAVAQAAVINSAMAPAAISTSIASYGSAAGIGLSAFLAAQAAGKAASLAGIAHGGLDNVPQTATYLLKQGEGVIRPNQNALLAGFLADYNETKGARESSSVPRVSRGDNIQINTTVYSSSISSKGMKDVADQLTGQIMRNINKSRRNNFNG